MPNHDGRVVGESILSVGDDVAPLHGLVSSSPNPRWLLHTAIVERLCRHCGVLLLNSDDAYLIGAGNQHSQRLLGYEIAALRLPRFGGAPTRRRAGVPTLPEVDLQQNPAVQPVGGGTATGSGRPPPTG